MMKQFNILDIPIQSITKKEFLDLIENRLIKKEFTQIATVNAEFLVKTLNNANFKEILQSKTFNIADGISVRAAAYYLNLKKPKNIFLRTLTSFIQGIYTGGLIIFNKKCFSQLPETLAGSDLFWDIIKIANKNNKSVYLLGSTQKNLDLINKKIENKFSNLKIVGYSNADSNDSSLPQNIANSRPDILLVGFGAPKQEFFLNKNRELINYKLGVGLGGTFDFISGSTKRAPIIFRKIGLEWLWRLILEPTRIKRIINAVIIFPILIFIRSIKQDRN